MDFPGGVLKNPPMDRISVAIFGVGGWARQALLPALAGLPDVDVVGCVDPEPANAIAAGIDARYDTLAELFADHDVDLLVVAAPDHLHVGAVRAALSRETAVYCEKPCGDSPDAVAELSNVAASARVPATVGYSFRYSPAIQALRADLADGTLGDVWLIELFEHNPQFHPITGRPMNWKGDPAYAAAGALLEYGSHVVDLCQWLLGPIAEVSADLLRIRPDARLDDVATLQLRFADGAAGTLLCGWVLTGGYPGITVRLHTSAGLAEVVLSDLLPRGQRYSRYRPDGTTLTVDEPKPVDGGHARAHLADLLATMRTQTVSDTLPTLRDAARTQRVIAAALRATQRWQRVTADRVARPSG